jgi:hypothetical protein
LPEISGHGQYTWNDDHSRINLVASSFKLKESRRGSCRIVGGSHQTQRNTCIVSIIPALSVGRANFSPKTRLGCG